MKKLIKIGKKIFQLNRSLTGKDNLITLRTFKTFFPKLKIKHFSCGKKVYDWKIPDEWNLRKAFVKDKYGKKIIDFKHCNLHVISYSDKINKKFSKVELLKKIYTSKNNKKAIPYVTSYYEKNWGFCASHNQKKQIEKNYKKNDTFSVFIDSSFKKKGKMFYGEILLPGTTSYEILISTYICHPSMANNELSGPLVTLALAKYFSKRKLKCGIRFVFVPETIGAIAYIHKNFNTLKKNVKGGYILTCIGDDRNYSLLQSKYSNSISDLAAKEAFNKYSINYKKFSFLNRGSDERQYNSPYIDLGLSSIMRTKYGEFKEYHTSNDKFGTVVTSTGLYGGFKIAKEAIMLLMNKEKTKKLVEKKLNNPRAKYVCEPHLSKRKLTYTISNLSNKNVLKHGLRQKILNFLQYADGSNSLKEISRFIKLKKHQTKKIFKICKDHNLVF